MSTLLSFYKYQGTGNDFVMIDNRTLFFPKSNTELIAQLCDRRFGIGADGLILIEQDDTTDFKMVYYNADGNESTMCGNGGRCLVAFAKHLGVIQESGTFIAVDGLHYATIDNDNIVALQMKGVDAIQVKEKGFFLNTGSPHHVEFVSDLKNFDVYEEGKKIRWDSVYQPGGTNVNFVMPLTEDSFAIRTFERGVEDETLSCGTGATAVAIAMNYSGKTSSNEIKIHVEGGELKVQFQTDGTNYTDVFLIGPAQKVFEGSIVVTL